MNDKEKKSVEDFIKSIYIVSSRRTSLQLAKETLFEAVNILQDRFSFFKKIKINIEAAYDGGFYLIFSDDISTEDNSEISNALESLIRVIYDEISEESGLYFITEIKNHLSKECVHQINDFGIDLDKIQSEQHFAYTRRKRKKESKDGKKKENPLGYTWGSVAKWDYNQDTKQVELFNDDGILLDKIDVQQAIQRYVETLSGVTEISPLELANLLEEHEKAYSFLKLIYTEDVDFITAKNMLNLTDEAIDMIIKDLIEMQLLQYVSKDEIEITKAGKEFISKKEK